MTDSYSRFHSFHEVSVSKKIMGFLNLTRKKVFQMFTDILLVVMLETTETTGVKQD